MLRGLKEAGESVAQMWQPVHVDVWLGSASFQLCDVRQVLFIRKIEIIIPHTYYDRQRYVSISYIIIITCYNYFFLDNCEKF